MTQIAHSHVEPAGASADAGEPAGAYAVGAAHDHRAPHRHAPPPRPRLSDLARSAGMRALLLSPALALLWAGVFWALR